MDAKTAWTQLENEIHECRLCPLGSQRTYAVPGEGNRHAMVMFIGEGPGHDEDISGRPFVGKAGQLLDKMISSIDLKREEVYIANVVKCRPPQNRVPLDEEADACLPYLRKQFQYIRPRIIVCLGATALKHVIDKEARITRSRGIWVERKGCFMIATYHPAALLRDPAKKQEAWQDLLKIRDKIAEIRRENPDAQGAG